MILNITLRYKPVKAGGAERQLERLASALAAKGLDVAILTWDGGCTRLPRREISGGVTVYRLKERCIMWGGKRRLAGIWVGLTMLKFLLSHRRNIRFVHVHDLFETAFFAKFWCAFLRIPCAAKATGIRSIYNGIHSRWGAMGIFFWKCITGTKWVIAMSPYIERTLMSYKIPAGKIMLVPNGVDVPANVPARADKPNGCFTMASTSALIKGKRMEIAIEALAILSKTCPDIRLAAAGAGPEKASLERLCQTKGISDNVRWLGFLEDVEGLLRDADIFIHPSEYEGVSNSILEAMALGLPVIVRDAEFNSGLVIDGVTGLKFDGTPEGLASCIKRLKDDRDMRMALGRNARDKVLREYGFSTVCGKYLSALERAGVKIKG
jgi:glycosyltransferase involved in cell wall biosynthesis